MDDFQFCRTLHSETSICAAPGGYCFGDDGTGDFKGYVRFTLGSPEILRKCIPLLQSFIEKYYGDSGQ